MANNGHVVFAFGALALVKGMNGRIFESSDGRSKPDGAAKVWRTTFRHLHSGASKIAGLFHSRINAGVSSQFCGRTVMVVSCVSNPASSRAIPASKTAIEASRERICSMYCRMMSAKLPENPTGTEVTLFVKWTATPWRHA